MTPPKVPHNPYDVGEMMEARMFQALNCHRDAFADRFHVTLVVAGPGDIATTAIGLRGRDDSIEERGKCGMVRSVLMRKASGSLGAAYVSDSFTPGQRFAVSLSLSSTFVMSYDDADGIVRRAPLDAIDGMEHELDLLATYPVPGETLPEAVQDNFVNATPGAPPAMSLFIGSLGVGVGMVCERFGLSYRLEDVLGGPGPTSLMQAGADLGAMTFREGNPDHDVDNPLASIIGPDGESTARAQASAERIADGRYSEQREAAKTAARDELSANQARVRAGGTTKKKRWWQ